MGLFSGLFGGGGTKVNQQAANTTNVAVDVGIAMDMGPIAAIMEWLGLKQVEYQDKNLALTEASNKSINNLFAALKANEDKELEQKQQVIDGVLPWVNRLGMAAIVAIAIWIWKKWK